MKLLTYNIWEGGFKEGDDRRTLILNLITQHASDILCLQEATDFSHLSEKFAKHYQLSYDPNTSVAIFSKFAIEHSEIFDNRLMMVSVPFADDKLDIYNIHLPFHPLYDDIRLRMLTPILRHARKRASKYQCIVGDFNSRTINEFGLPWTEEFIWRRAGLSEQPSDQQWVKAISRVKNSGFSDTYRMFSNNGPGYSYQTPSYKFFEEPKALDLLAQSLGVTEDTLRTNSVAISKFQEPGIRLDYIFCNSALMLQAKACKLDDSDQAKQCSDHLPLYAIFNTD